MMAEAKTILLTGAAGSLGSTLALQCARAGYSVVLLDLDRRGLERVSDRIVGEGLPEPALHPLDLSAAGPDDFREMLDAIKQEFDGLTALVHCAARFEALAPLEHISPGEWVHSMKVNLNAAWLLSVMSLPLLRSAESARLYFMLDDLARVSGALWGPYGVSKHALKGLAEQLSRTCVGTSVQVLGIFPGPMQSALRSRAFHAEDPTGPVAPAAVASEILNLLEGRRQPEGTFVDLAARSGSGIS
jgi:NAD(P)-dependent dehydrogenase (short-subunit alcohol dehydrogenase family)